MNYSQRRKRPFLAMAAISYGSSNAFVLPSSRTAWRTASSRSLTISPSASEAIHKPLHEETLMETARSLSSLSGKYGGLYTAEAGVGLNSNSGVLGFQVEENGSPLDYLGLNLEEGRGLLEKSYNSPTGEAEGVNMPLSESQILQWNVKELKLALAQRGLPRTGKKAELQNRLLRWSEEQKNLLRVRSRLEGLRELLDSKRGESEVLSNVAVAKTEEYDVEALTSRRKAINEKKNSQGVLGLVDESYFEDEEADDEEEDDENESPDRFEVSSASRAQLSRSYNTPTQYSNRELREMYIQAKFADQNGDRKRCKYLLNKLLIATPNDGRIVRRLARLETQEGNTAAARQLLLSGIQKDPHDAHLLHGLAQLERKLSNDSTARHYFSKAIEINPTFANPYHALGTMEHSCGNIQAALAVLQKGLVHNPSNHRLHHALGDVYLDAQKYDLARESYNSALRCMNKDDWGKAFLYNSLSHIAYAKGDIEKCRALLRQSLEVNGMHAQGVVAWATLEESEGNINDARRVYRDAIGGYEKKRSERGVGGNKGMDRDVDPFDTSSFLSGAALHSGSYAGDKWINVIRSWARMEEIHGCYETAHVVFSRGARLFPESVVLLTEWARLQVANGDEKKGQLLFEAACQRAGGRSFEPYKLFAEFEMKRGNFEEAQSLLRQGAQIITKSLNNGITRDIGLASLLHTWGVCEYHLGNVSDAELLFNDAIRATGSGEVDSNIRSLILYSMARLEFNRGEYLLAQHCVGLSLKENLLPGGNSRIWFLWADIAREMDNEHLVECCREQAFLRREEEGGGTAEDLSRILAERVDTSESLPGRRIGSAMKDMFRRTPWYSKVCVSGKMDKTWYEGACLWDTDH